MAPLILLLAAPAIAQEGPEEVHETIVRAAPTDASRSQVSREEIERGGSRTAAEALEREPGLFATTGARGERIFSMRGFSQTETLVLLDGAPAYIPYDGQLDLGMVPAELVDHITILKGPASVVFGPNGLGGAVNIVTRRPGQGPLAEVMFESRYADAFRLSAYHAMEAGPVGWQAYGGIDQMDYWTLPHSFAATPNEDGGARENSDARKVHAGAGVSVRLGPTHRLLVKGLFLDGERGVPPSTRELLPRYWRFTSWRAAGFSLAHEGAVGRLDMDEMAWARLYSNLLDAYDDEHYSTQQSPRAMHSLYEDQQLGGRVRLRYGLDLGKGVALRVRLWTSGQYERHEANPDGAYSRAIFTVAKEAEAVLHDAWAFLLGLQVDVEAPGQNVSPSARFGLGPLARATLRPNDKLAISLSGARRTRFPTLKERFSLAMGQRIPNPDLGPESAWHLGLDASYSPWRALGVGLGLFDAEVADLIERVALGNGKEQLQNVGKARFLGAELALTVRPFAGFFARASYAYLYARRADNTPLALRPAHKAGLEATYSPLAWLELWAMAQVVGHRDYQDPETRVWGRLAPFVTLHAKVEVRPAKWMRIYVRGTNLLDATIESEYGFPEPGRELWLGCRLALDQDT